MASQDTDITLDAETALGDFDDTPRLAPLALTIAWHSDLDRVGERMPLPVGRTEVSRNGPLFAPPGGGPARPLKAAHVSRDPIYIDVGATTVTLSPPASRQVPVVERVPLDAPRTWSRRTVCEEGVLLLIGNRVLLLLHALPAGSRAERQPEIVGESAGIVRVRQDIDRAARLDAPVLVRGETGVGKELVARAIHEASPRAAGPYVTVNAGAITPSMVASALFGHRKGAFTGATGDSIGYFGGADGGSLFLDEIGELPAEAQPALLRAMDTGEVQPVGARKPSKYDVRVIAATDADLEALVEDGRFRKPLYHRLRVFEVRVPPLRERRDDIPRLLLHMLREPLGKLGALDRLELGRRTGKPWLSAARVATLVRHDWPGNVRELRNVAQRIATAAFDREQVRGLGLFDWVEASTTDTVGGSVAGNSKAGGSKSTSRFTDPGFSVTDVGGRRATAPDVERLPGGPDGTGWSPAQVLRTMRASGWSVHRASRTLEVPKTSLMRYIDRVLDIRKLVDIPDPEVRSAFEVAAGDLERMSDSLMVSRRALRRRLRQMGLTAIEDRPT